MGLRAEGEITIPSHFSACITCQPMIDLDNEADSKIPEGVESLPIKIECEPDRKTGSAQIHIKSGNSSEESLYSFETERTVNCPALASQKSKLEVTS